MNMQEWERGPARFRLARGKLMMSRVSVVMRDGERAMMLCEVTEKKM